MTLEYLYRTLKNETDAINWCQVNGILNLDPICPKCSDTMSLSRNRYRCNKAQCKKIVSVTSGTIFQKSQVSIKKIVLLIYYWVCEFPVVKTAFQLGISANCVSTWFLKLRNMAGFFYFLNFELKIGGPDSIVEIDEALIVKRKYNRGRVLCNQQWIFGGVVRGRSDQCFIEFVSNRSRTTLLEIISRRIAPGTTIVSDSWRGYSNLETLLPQFQFIHKTVNHSLNFINPDNPSVHTQSVEGFWSVLKRKMRQRGTHKGENLDSYFFEFLYRKRHRADEDALFDELIRNIAEHF
jgi:hypothetical protein